ncbi:MAG: thiamine pyrophosphate-binding protein [Candidatus Freyarchaeota archaeon]
MRIKSSEAIIKVLEKENVSHIFSLPGGHIQPIFDAIYDSNLQLISVRHEQAAAHMADGYARFKREPGVCLGTAGPGATNLATGVAEAYVASSPLIVLTGQVSTGEMYRGALQEIDTVPIFSPITKCSRRVLRADRIPGMLRDAFRIALSGRYGPVHLDLPRDFLKEEIEYQDLQPEQYRPKGSTEGNPAAIEEAADVFLSAENPVILVGGGVRWAQAKSEVMALAELLGAPVMTTLTGKGVVPEDSPLVLGLAPAMLLSESGWSVISDCDAALAVGCRFSGVSTVDWFLPIPRDLIHVDIDPQEIGKNYPVRVGITGDARSVLQKLKDILEKKLTDVAKREKRKEKIKNTKQRLADELLEPERTREEKKGKRITPRVLMSAVQEFIRGETVIVTDVGNNQLWTLRYLNVQEVETAVRHGIKVIVVVMNNRGPIEIKQMQEVRYSKRVIGVDYLDVDFSMVAKGFGAHAERVEDPREINGALESAANSDRLAVIDVIFDDSQEISPWVVREALKKK